MIFLVLIGLNFTICAVLVRNGMKSIQVIVRSDPDLDPLRMRIPWPDHRHAERACAGTASKLFGSISTSWVSHAAWPQIKIGA
jgi:hypothetical protein